MTHSEIVQHLRDLPARFYDIKPGSRGPRVVLTVKERDRIVAQLERLATQIDRLVAARPQQDPKVLDDITEQSQHRRGKIT